MAEKKKTTWEEAQVTSSDVPSSQRIATALSFDPEKDSAPTIKAVGKGHLATKIIETAKENDIPVVKDDALASSLAALNIGTSIPPELYEVVARLLIFISKIDKRH